MINIREFLPPYLKFPENLSTNILLIENWFDCVAACIYIGYYMILSLRIFYYIIYFGICYLLVNSHPARDDPVRIKNTQEERRRGFKALLYVVGVTPLIIWKIVPQSPYYGYFDTNEYTLKDFLFQVIIYMLTFDLWFYSTHLLFHTPFFWKRIHAEHHEFIEPGAYAQDAVHPIEALIEGPIGHFLPIFLYPFHPVTHHIFGLLTSVYAQFAHDGRWDPMGHNYHHYYYSCNYGLYGFCDILFGTKYSKAKYPVEYIPTWERQKIK